MRVLILLLMFLFLVQPASADRGYVPPDIRIVEDSQSRCDTTLLASVPGQVVLDPIRYTGCGSNSTLTAVCTRTRDLTCEVTIRLTDGSIWVERDRFDFSGPVFQDGEQIFDHRMADPFPKGLDPAAWPPFSQLISEGDANARTATVNFSNLPELADTGMVTYRDLTTGEYFYIIILHKDDPEFVVPLSRGTAPAFHGGPGRLPGAD